MYRDSVREANWLRGSIERINSTPLIWEDVFQESAERSGLQDGRFDEFDAYSCWKDPGTF